MNNYMYGDLSTKEQILDCFYMPPLDISNNKERAKLGLPPIGTDKALETQVGGDHYKKMAIQPIEYILANKLDWCEGNIVKYITRHHQKNGRADVEKVIHYAQILLETKYK